MNPMMMGYAGMPMGMYGGMPMGAFGAVGSTGVPSPGFDPIAVETFCTQNSLDGSAVRLLKEQSADVQEKVIAEGFLTGSNKSAVLMSRVRRITSTASATATPAPPGSTSSVAAAGGTLS